MLVAAHGHAQAPQRPGDPSYVHESWTIKDGLPVNSVNAILQDSSGYLWIATFDGLVRFDGVRFTVFNSATSPELPSNRITRLYEGRDRTLWVRTAQGHIVRFRDGEFTNVPFENGAPKDLTSNLVVDSSGAVWVGNATGLWKTAGDRLVRVAPEVISRPVASIMKRTNGELWLGTDAGVVRVGSDGGVTKLVSDPALDTASFVTLFEDRRGGVWLAGRRQLWFWRDRPVEVKAAGQSLSVSRFVEVAGTTSTYVETATSAYRVDSTGATLIDPRLATNPEQLVKLWGDEQVLWMRQDDGVFRNGRRVLTLPADVGLVVTFVDREGSIWLGTGASGLHRVKRALFTVYSEPEGLLGRNVYPTYVDRTGAVWAGSQGKDGVSRIDPATGRVAFFVGRPPHVTRSVYLDDTNRLWIGGNQGLYVCELPAMTCRAEGPPPIRGREVLALHGEVGGGLWAGGAAGLYRYDAGEWTAYPSSSGAPAATVRAFATARDGAIWMGTDGGGIARFHNGSFTRVTQADGLPSDLVRSLYVDADGWLWVGTEGRGLARLDVRTLGRNATAKPAIVRIGSEHGLFDEAIHQILEDDAGRVWMNTNRGIFWVPRLELVAFADGRIPQVRSTAYSERDGLRNREGNGGVQPAGAKGPDGRLWFPTQDGVVVVDPRDVGGERPAPPVVIERLLAAGRAIRLARDSVSLAPSQRDVQIEYTALTFLEPANVRFRYRLDNYDSAWVDVGGRRTAFYTQLPPGRYTFRVQASNAAGQWHEPGTTLAVRVVPRFWETAAFRWAAFATLGVLAVVVIRLRDARHRARSAHLERVVDERTAALREREHELAERNSELQSLDQAKSRFFANVSHELRTPLTLTIGPLEDIRTRTGDDQQVQRWLDIALRNSRRLLRLVNQILDVAKLEAGAMHLAPRPLDLAPFTRGIVGAFAPVAEQKGIRLTTDAPEALVGAFDADAVEKILTNLLSNAIKFTPNGGEVDIRLSRERDAVSLRVRDSGIGIPPEQLGHVFERFYRVDESATRSQAGTGIGLALVKELVELHGGEIVVESGSAGTTFTATIPIGAEIDGVSIPDAAHVPGRISTAVTAEHDAGARDVASDDRGEDIPTLLVVDDSADLRAYIRDHFAPRFRVIEAGDGAEGIELARRHLPDVVISDVMMPGTDGHELVRALRESTETSFLAIILLTAQAEDDQRIEGLERGADDYMVKPFEMRELDVRVRNLIAARRRLRERFSTLPPAAESPTVPARTLPDEAYAARVHKVIRERLTDPDFGVAELADGVAQDRSHLSRRVKEVFGETPTELIRRTRLEEGARLLRDETGSVADVAYSVGFNSVSYFCRCFHDTYALTPAAYRARQTVQR